MMAADINAAYNEYVRKKDTAALERLVADGEGLVRHFAAMYGAGLDLDDLYQTGVIGLLRAVKTYDPCRGTAFSTWASSCIVSEIRHYVRSEHSYMYPENADNLEGLDPESGPRVRLSLSSVPDFDAENCLSLSPRPFDLEVENRVALEQAYKRLGELQRKIINALFYRQMTQRQAADELGITQRRVSRQKCAALKILRKLLEAPNFKLIDSKDSFRLRR